MSDGTTHNAGVDSWLSAMEASRRALEELGSQVTDTLRAAAPVGSEDLARVVQALNLLEEAGSALRDRADRSEARADALEARVQALQEQLVALTGAVSRLADVVVSKGAGQ
ncbi:MAG: hypothetical protein KDA24_28960 [Deltaproteobacteria bacterium]|nr:hypothetical protein [Deltaproteobacteria bacterium]